MCGITGIITTNHTISESTLRRMNDAITHRGPDGEGVWQDEKQGIFLGHRRLAIIDLSHSSDQPFTYLNNRYITVFNGEIYNYIELREELTKQGYFFQTNSDTEVLVCLYHVYGSECLNKLDGMFAFAIWDNELKKLFCARDRFGEKPFFYTRFNGALYFASEMKAFWAAGIPKIPNESRVFRLLAYNTMVDSDNRESTFFDNIYQLKPSHYMVYEDHRITNQQRYWDIDLSKRSNLNYKEACDEFRRLFEISVKRRLRSDVPVGSSLSGGLDSSSIVCTIEKIKSLDQQQKTFSARFNGFKRDEGSYIAMVNEQAKSEGHEVFLTEDLLYRDFEQVCYHQEEPFGSSSILAQYNVMKLAKEQAVTVLLDGQGADEYLAGYSPYFADYFKSLRLKNPEEFRLQTRNYEALYGIVWSNGKFSFIDTLFPALRDKLRRIKNKLSSPTYLKQFSTDFLNKNQKLDYSSQPAKSLNEALYNSLFLTSLPVLLRYADRNSMANSREVRLPFLFHELVEFVFSLPDDYQIRNCWTKAILRNSMEDILPESVCWRKEKVGFEPPNYRYINKELVERSIDQLVRLGILNKQQILDEKAWDYVQIAALYE